MTNCGERPRANCMIQQSLQLSIAVCWPTKARCFATEFSASGSVLPIDRYRGVDAEKFPSSTNGCGGAVGEAITFFEHVVRADRPVKETPLGLCIPERRVSPVPSIENVHLTSASSRVTNVPPAIAAG